MKTTIPKVGIHYDIPFDEYLAWDAWHASFLKDVEHTPHYAWARKQQGEADDAEKAHYSKGRLFHCLVGQPSKVDEDFVLRPDTYTSDRGKDKGKEKPWHGGAKVCEAWAIAQAGRSIISRDTMEEAAAMAHRVCDHHAIAPLIADCKVEVSIVWEDKLTGALCKGRYDLFKNGIIVDLKSTSSAAGPSAFFYEAMKYRYHIQCAMYIDGGKALGMFGDKVPWFAFAAVEGYFPHEIAVYDVQDDPSALSYDFLMYGRLKYRAALQVVEHCKKTGNWTGYGPESYDMELTYQGRKEFEEMGSM